MIPFLRSQEQQEMQLGDQFCYEIAVGRVVTNFTIRKAPILFIGANGVLGFYDFYNRKPRAIQRPSMMMYT